MDSLVTAGVFLGIIAWSEGLRVLPAETHVLRRLPFDAWRVAGGPETERRIRVVSWCLPVAVPLIVGPDASAAAADTRAAVALLRERSRRVRRHLAALQVNGVAILVALVAGLPMLVGRSGAWGLLVGLAAIGALACVQAATAAAALARLGERRGRALLTAARYCWPFAAQRAPEDLQRRVAAGLPALVLMHELLPPDEFARVARPLLYDALVRGAHVPDTARLLAHMGEPDARALLALPASEPGASFCPRCGTAFDPRRAQCSDCAGVALTAGSSR